MYKEITQSMEDLIQEINKIYSDDQTIQKMFRNGLENTFLTTLEEQEDGAVFVITGDIPAMWLRDSAAQVRPLLMLADSDEKIKSIIRGVIDLQFRQIMFDPYANAFNKEPDADGEGQTDLTDMSPMVWERKYEIDSLCYPIQLAYLYHKATGDTTVFDETFRTVCHKIMDLFIVEQDHMNRSPYSFQRVADWLLFDHPERIEYETLRNMGRGSDVKRTGMTWSGFRPSDDACRYGYLVPSNMFAVVILRYMEEIATVHMGDMEMASKARGLSVEIDEGIKKHAVVEHKTYGKVYAYEVDGLGNGILMDDANVPSLLSAPYLGYCDIDDEIYQNTRRMLLSETNPNYFEGKYAKGIGSNHTARGYIWHIAMAIQGMTSDSEAEKEDLLEMFKTTTADTYMMHEGFNVDDPFEYTRPWFSWSNSMFAEFLLHLNDRHVKGSPLDKVLSEV